MALEENKEISLEKDTAEKGPAFPNTSPIEGDSMLRGIDTSPSNLTNVPGAPSEEKKDVSGVVKTEAKKDNIGKEKTKGKAFDYKTPSKVGLSRIKINVDSAWRITLLTSIGVNILIISLSGVFFFRSLNESIFIVPQREQPSVETINREELRNAVNHFEERLLEFENTKLTRPSFIDPSN